MMHNFTLTIHIPYYKHIIKTTKPKSPNSFMLSEFRPNVVGKC